MTKKKNLGVSKSVLNKFIIREHGPKYLPRVRASADEKIFSSLVKSAITNITKSAFGTSASAAVDDSQDAVTASLARSAPAVTTSAPLFRQSQSQIAAAALKAINVGRKNV